MVEAGADGWFAGQGGASKPVEEGRRVAARLATPSDTATRAGLPLRRSRAHLVPGAFETVPEAEAPQRSADEVRDRLRGYQSGLRRARHED